MARYIDFLLVKSEGGSPQAPARKYDGDAGWDLFASREVVIPPGETRDVHTDVRIALPPFTFARIVGRSSTLKVHRLMVSEGIIDNGYTGELFCSVHNVGSEPFAVERGMRLAQVIIHRIEDVRWSEVEEEHFREGPRGGAGFGSTGLFEIDPGVQPRGEYDESTRGTSSDPQRRRMQARPQGRNRRKRL